MFGANTIRTRSHLVTAHFSFATAVTWSAMLRCGASLAVSRLRVHECGEPDCFVPMDLLFIVSRCCFESWWLSSIFRRYLAMHVLPNPPSSRSRPSVCHHSPTVLTGTPQGFIYEHSFEFQCLLLFHPITEGLVLILSPATFSRDGHRVLLYPDFHRPVPS